MLSAGIPPYRVADYLGHDLNVLLTIYSHIIDGTATTTWTFWPARPRRSVDTSLSRTGQTCGRQAAVAFLWLLTKFSKTATRSTPFA